MKPANLKNYSSLLLFAMMAGMLSFNQSLQAATDTWQGNASALFSGLNWTGGNNPPVSADALVFGVAGTAGTALTADQAAAISYAGITFNSGASAYTIGGANGITLTGNIVNNSTSLETLNFPIVATAARTFTTTAAGGDITLGGNITGTGGGITKTGSGTLNLSGTSSPTGSLRVSNGKVAITSGSLTLGSFSFVGDTASQSGIASVASGAALNFNNVNGGGLGYASAASGAVYNSGTYSSTQLYMSDSVNNGSYGYVRNAGTMTIGNTLAIGRGNNESILDIVAGGATTIGTSGGLNLASAANATAGLNITGGGTLTDNKTTEQGVINSGAGAYSSINISGAGSKLVLTGGSGFNFNNVNNVASTNTFTVASGGELDMAYCYNNNAASVNTFFNFNGGTVKATATDGNGLFINNTAIYIHSGGATIDANGFNPKVGVPLLTPSGNGVTSIALGGTTTGYIGAPVVKIVGGGGQGAAAIASFDPSSGTVTGITVTAPGSGYTSAPTVTLAGGNGGSTGSGAGTATATASIGAVSSGGLTKVGAGALLLRAANTYTGNTVVSAGTLMLTNSGSLASSGIIVSNGAIFDVSSISFTLGGSQSLGGYGTNNGNVNTTTGSKIYAGTDGGYGTNTFNGNLTLVSGAVCYFDLTTNYNGSNDLINVTGSLADNGSMQISAPSTSVNLDTNQDYVLMTSAGLSGTISPTPLWGVKPLNWRNFTVVQNGNNVQLHYTSSTPPVATGSASPATVTRNQSTLVSVTVTPGTGTVDPNTGVALDVSSLSLSSPVYLVLSGTPNVYTNTITIPGSASAGSYTLNALVTDSTPLTGSANISLAIVVTNQVWNGAGANNLSDNNTNWSSGSAPGYAGDGVTFAGSVNTSPDMDQNYTVTGVTFSTNAGSFTISTAESTTLTLTNGTGVVNNSTNAQTLNVPVALSTAQTFNAASGNINVAGIISGTGGLTKTGNGALTLSGNNTFSGVTIVSAGTAILSGNNTIGDVEATNGLLKVTAGTSDVASTAGNTYVDRSGNLEVDSNATVNITGNTAWFPIGNTVGTTSTVTVAGGTLNIANGYNTALGRIGYGVLTINSGTFSSTDTHNIGLVIGDQGAAQGGTVNLNGGSLLANKIVSNNGTNYFYFNGGTLSPTASTASWWNNSAKLSAQVRNGGAIIDDAGFSVTLAQNLLHSTVGGDNALDGGLIKNGAGTLTLAGTNTYTGNTTISNGTLALATSGSIISTNINVTSGAYFDVSALASYTLNSSQKLEGSGQVNVAQNGLVAAASGSAIYPGTDGTIDNLTINGGLTLDSGATANLDLDTTYNGANDRITVNSTLTLNGNSIHIKAPSTSSSLDTTADYVLITAGSISGSFSSTPVWEVKPVNWANYTVVTSGSQVALHYSTLTPPTGSGLASPSTAVHNQEVLISVTVTNGSGTVDPNTGVVLNASTIGGSSAVALVLSGTPNVYTNTIAVPPSAAAGSYTLSAVITDSNGQIGTANIALDVSTTEVWNGGGSDQNWSTNPNWVSGVSPDFTGNGLIFAGTAGTSPNMDNSYSVSGLTFSNNAASFTIGSTTSSTLTLTGGVTNNSVNAQTLNVPIADAGGGLTKSGNGTVILSAVNTYTGNTTINAGVLNISGAGQLNSGTYSAAIVDNGTFAYNSSAEQVLSGVISGTGALTQSAGVLVLDNASNTFSGNITVSGYLLATNNVAFNFGKNPTQGPLGNPATTNRTITVNSGGTLVLGMGNVFGDGGSTNAPAVSLVINHGGAVQTAAPIPAFPGNGGGDANIFGDITLNGGTFSTGNGYANSPDYQAAILLGSVTVGGSAASTINSIASNANANGLMLGKQGGGTVTFNVATTGAGGADLIVTAPLVNAPNNTTGALLKVGSGTLQLDATNTYAGSTTVSNGTLVGLGKIAGPVVVAPTGSIGAGDVGANVGALTINNNLTLQGVAKLRISKTGGTLTNDLITGISTATYGGLLVVSNVTSDATPLAAGDTFTLFSAGTHSGNFTSIIGSPGAGLQYSFTNGVLSVVTTGPSGPAPIASSYNPANGQLTLTWPARVNWRLESQTNNLTTGLSTTGWSTVSGTSDGSYTATVDPSKPTVFYRLVYP